MYVRFRCMWQVRDLSRSIIQSCGGIVVLELWLFVGYIFGRIGVFVLFMLASSAASFALALHWRWRHRGKCRWLHQSRIAISYL